MSLLRRLFGRRDAMDEWSAGLERRSAARPAASEPRTPDAEPEDVPVHRPRRASTGAR